jgi:Tfp pilus assembly protein PilN
LIEVNLHPDRARARRGGGKKFALPAALKRFGGKHAGRGTAERDIWTTIAIVVPLLTLLVVGWLWYSQRSARSDLDSRLATAVEDSTRLSDLRSLSDSLNLRDRRISERLDLVKALDDGRFVWPHLLDEISRAMPSYTWLTEIRRSQPLPDLEVQIDGLAANPLAITRFVRNLQESPYVRQVRIIGSQQEFVDNVAAQAFRLMIAYEAPPPDLTRTEPIVGGL